MWFLKKERNVQILLIYLVSFFVFSAFFNYSMLDNTETIVSNHPLIKDWSAHYTLDSNPKPKNPWEGWPEIPRQQAINIIVILHFICIFILIDDSIEQSYYRTICNSER